MALERTTSGIFINIDTAQSQRAFESRQRLKERTGGAPPPSHTRPVEQPADEDPAKRAAGLTPHKGRLLNVVA